MILSILFSFINKNVLKDDLISGVNASIKNNCINKKSFKELKVDGVVIIDMNVLNIADQSGKLRGPINVTAQNVSHWFQNRRRKDNHPEIEEKRVKKRSARMKRATPLDLTQHPMSSTYQGNHSVSEAMMQQQQRERERERDRERERERDSDDDAGSLFIADKVKSEVENDDDNVHYPVNLPAHNLLFHRGDQV